MARGTVKWFSDQKGYGFITADGGEVSDVSSEVYVHFSAIEAPGFRTLHPGEKVEVAAIKDLTLVVHRVHDPEKWTPVFRKDPAPEKTSPSQGAL